MLIYDDHADSLLIKALETIRSQDVRTVRYLHFKPAANRNGEAMQKPVLEACARHLSSNNPQVYLCEDGDILILAPALASKTAKTIMLEVAEILHIPVTDNFVQFADLFPHINLLLSWLDDKMEKRRKAAEILREKQEHETLERKRQSILNSHTKNSSEEISKKRLARKTPEFMIIEDDAFSRRLVENVLQKQYPLTGLGEATKAIETYVRIAPDLLFLDINLPDVTGHELLEKIIALDPQAYVVMLSGNADKENITQAIRLGAKGFVAKPFTREKLFQYIDRCPTLKQQPQ